MLLQRPLVVGLLTDLSSLMPARCWLAPRLSPLYGAAATWPCQRGIHAGERLTFVPSPILLRSAC